MESQNEEDDGNIEDIDLKTWTSWTYKILHRNYQLYMNSDDIAGDFLKARLQYHTKLKSSSSCCGRHNREMSYIDADVKPFFIDIGKFIKRILKDESYSVYKDINGSDKIQRRDVLIWSVIINRRDYAIDILKDGSTIETKLNKGTCIYAALFASAMFKVLSKKADALENMDLGESFMENSRFFEVLASNGIAEMYVNDRAMSQKILTQPVEEYGCSMKTVMKISANNKLMLFMGTTACQTKLKSIWRGHMSILTSREMILLCIFLPFLIPRIKFLRHTNGEKRDYKEPFLRINWCGCTDSSKGKLGIIDALYLFYSAPVTKFWTNVISCIVMLFCFSFFVLTDLRPFTDGQFSLMEYLIFGWILTLVLEELRQICQREQRSLRHRLCSWWKDAWNKYDVFMNFLFLLSVVLRFALHQDNFKPARMMYSVTLAFFIIRTLQFFYVAKNTGPKIIMIRKMVTVLLFFIMIFAVVLVSFGIIMQANLYPNSELTFALLRDVVNLPYWQMYGELFLEIIEGQESSTCTMEPSVYKNSTLPRCPESTALVPVVLAIYMVLTNLMLLNLLIAMFSNTFQKVQDNAVLIWKFHRYSLVHEYYERPVLAPPLIIINHLYIGYFVYHKWCKKDFQLDNAFGMDMQEKNKVVAEFETKAMDECFKSLDDRHGSKVPRTRSYYHMSNDNIERDEKLNEIAELCNQVNQKLAELVESTA
ncbi:transient receptor potential cation channel subfamily M member 1-like isoform X2 [Mytilus californianus]|uniref:transient receptor potential cation channel subfamily M member 1-like isoform X2 n=1 Tax=Mytilus californianus TaxID=6549 RepID=UPI0022460897|nr:transient receptor potential cation channel subfamily M member 1-like isoform X2 [Mytilus californianus]